MISEVYYEQKGTFGLELALDQKTIIDHLTTMQIKVILLHHFQLLLELIKDIQET